MDDLLDSTRNKKIIDLKTALLNDVGLERNRFYSCRCVVANARAIYRFSVSIFDYILCISWVLAYKVMSLTFRRNINLHVFKDEFVVKKGFLTSTVHIPKQSLMSH